MNPRTQISHRRVAAAWSRLACIVPVLVAMLFLGAWHDFTGNTINPNFVKRIQDGKTTRNEILLWFGDPKEIQKTEIGPVYKYFSYKDTPPDMPYRPENRKIAPQSDQLYTLADNNKIEKPKIKTEGKILRSTLTVRFQGNKDIVMSHEYQEH